MDLSVAWHGTSPVCLLIITDADQKMTVIDVDEPGWHKTHGHLMRAVGSWYLCGKDGRPWAGMRVSEGEHPYYVARHVGIGTLPPRDDGQLRSNEVVAYGIGKKRLDGHVDRSWNLLIDGDVFTCIGDDVEYFALQLIRRKQ